jgi:enediyne biosynthesis protein E7
VDDEIGGYPIEKGTTVLFSTLTLQRDPRFWPEPDRFNPDRFLRNEVHKDAYMPFGQGPRMCIGWRMAYIEAILTITTAYQRYRFEVPKHWRPIHEYRMSMGLKGGLPVTITRRTDGAGA